jgi:hypothetical protein
LKAAEEAGDKNATAYAYLNIGNIYFYSKNYNLAVKNWNLALRMFEDLNDGVGVIKCKGNIANYLVEIGKFTEALPYYQDIAKNFSESGNLVGLSMAENNIAKLYYEQGNYMLALKTCNNALDVVEKTGDKNNAAITYTALGEIYNKLKDFKNAEKYLNESLQITNEIGALDLKIGIYDALVSMYIDRNNYKEALNKYKLFIATRDSMFNYENNKKTSELQLKYDTEKKEQNIVLLSKEAQLKQAEIQKQNITRNILIGVFALMVFLAGLTYNRLLIKKKINTEIELTMHNLKTTQSQLVEREKLAALGKVTANVAKEIVTPIANVNRISTENNDILQSISGNTLSGNTKEKLQLNYDNIYNYGKEADMMIKKVSVETRKLLS